ncbi:hypothetical protein [Acinetobacter sp. Marseille-Q1623]|uniref:hypothetical protein n=1 Tax=Acinetobacter sp. Marseille-Q1623 TaxID=2697501 RepID=UPI00157A9E66|nr:hypothetical protein [Acinetobacter sp. Marseille-Q1623]
MLYQRIGIGGDSSRALNAVMIAITGALGGQTDLQTASNALAPLPRSTPYEVYFSGGMPNRLAYDL